MSGTERLDQVKLRARWARDELDLIRQEMIDRGSGSVPTDVDGRALREIGQAYAQLALAVCSLNFATNVIVHGLAYAEQAERVASAMPFTAGEFLRNARLAAGLSIEDVAARIGTVPAIAELGRRQWIEMIEADAMPIAASTIDALHSVLSFDREALGRLIVAQAAEGHLARNARVHAAPSQPGVVA